MKRAQTGLGLVLLGVVAIVAVIGLVLLFTKASTPQGALLTDLSIGNVYGGGNVPGEGIAETYPTPDFIRLPSGGGIPAQPSVAYPTSNYYPTAVIKSGGTRIPGFIISGRYAEGERSGYAKLEDAYACEWDLINSGVPVPHNQFNFYQVPNKGISQEAYGRYPPASAAEPRPIKDYMGNLGGDIYAYVNSVGSEQTHPTPNDVLVRELIITKVVNGDKGILKHKWTTTPWSADDGTVVQMPVCAISAATFPFPQY